MKTARKAILLVLCAVMLVAASVMGTLAYLTDDDAVTNTFTVGQVGLELDEKDVNPDGTEVPNSDRVKENEYHLIPGHEYIKDPIVHVDANSENCYVFIKVDNNGIETIEENDTTTHPDYKTVAQQIADNGWIWMKNEGNVHYFYQTYAKGQTDKDLEVFQEFKVRDTATKEELATYYNGAAGNKPVEDNNPAKAVIVTAYAVQMDGFNNAEAAWNATFGAPQTNS